MDDATYWRRQERWERLGRELADLRKQADTSEDAFESLPGVKAKLREFHKLRRQLDER